MVNYRSKTCSVLLPIALCVGMMGLLYQTAKGFESDSASPVELSRIKEDANGDGTVDMIGDTVKVSGISNISSGLLHEQYLQVFIQNDTSGLSLFADSIREPILAGDSVVATGIVQEYNSLVEVKVLDYHVFSPNEPRSDLESHPLGSALNNLEQYEGMLIGGTGTVVGRGSKYNGKYLMVSPTDSAEQTIMVYVTNFHARYQDFDFESVSVGDQVQVAGVLTQYNPDPINQEALTYKIHLRTPADFGIVGISINQMIIWGSIGITLFLIAVAWVISLRSTVKSKTGELEESLHEKEILLKEIHHRVKNNLAIMSGLFELQLDSTENPATEKALRNSQARLQSMALVHDKLYQTSSLNDIQMDQYIPELVESLRNTFIGPNQNVALRFEIDDVRLNIDHAIPCGLLINEIVVNAFKHAFNTSSSDNGEITVSMSEANGEVRLVVADNGSGIPEDFEILESTSLGMMLIDTFRDQLSASMDISSKSGTRFSLTFPAN